MDTFRIQLATLGGPKNPTEPCPECPVLVPKGAYLNPALLILGVFGGLSLMGFIGALYGPVILILLVTSVDVYSKYLLRSDLETLQEAGRINLEELGLTPKLNKVMKRQGQCLLPSSRVLPRASDQVHLLPKNPFKGRIKLFSEE